MDDYQTPSERVAADLRQDYIDNMMRDQRNAPIGGSYGGGGGGGVAPGEWQGWAVPAGMIGAVIGGILGRGFLGAVIGALIFGGGVWTLVMMLKGVRGGGAVKDKPVIPWIFGGAVIGALLAGVLFLDESAKMGVAMQNLGIFGAVVGGGIRLVMRALAKG